MEIEKIYKKEDYDTQFKNGVGMFVFSDTEKYVPFLDREMSESKILNYRDWLISKGLNVGGFVLLEFIDGRQYYSFEILE